MSAPPLLTLQAITKAYGVSPLFADLSLVVSEGERLALVGDNGTGKSTLLQIIAGIEEPDEGKVVSRKGLRIAYVPQSESFEDDLSIAEVINRSIHASELGQGEPLHDGARRISLALGQMGFNDTSATVASLSGGWRKRLSIAAALAHEPDLLLLDEPTNHLDIHSIVWLEGFISALRCTIVFVSHDRYFIENLATRVLEINRRYPQGVLGCEGSYNTFLEHRALMQDQMQRQRESLNNKVRREVEWLRQGVKARTTKSQFRIDEAHRLIDQLSKISAPERGRAGIDFAASKRKTKELIKIEGISQQAGGKALFSDLSLTISPGTRLAIVGPNGSGKTTLVRTLFGDLPPASGRVVHAPHLSIALFDQGRSDAQRDVTLKEFLCPDGDSVNFCGESVHIAAWASRFLFSRDHLDVSLSSLSGGEKARAILARLMLREADILLFDEPTNDLDIATLEVLEESLDSFPGGVIIVTHDRYLLERTGSAVVGLLDGKAHLYGDYPQWESAQKTLIEEARRTQRPVKASKKSEAPTTPTDTPTAAPKTKLSYKDARALATIEDDIAAAEEALRSVQQELNDPLNASNAAKLSELCAALATRQEKVDELYARWQELETLQRAISPKR